MFEINSTQSWKHSQYWSYLKSSTLPNCATNAVKILHPVPCNQIFRRKGTANTNALFTKFMSNQFMKFSSRGNQLTEWNPMLYKLHLILAAAENSSLSLWNIYFVSNIWKHEKLPLKSISTKSTRLYHFRGSCAWQKKSFATESNSKWFSHKKAFESITS